MSDIFREVDEALQREKAEKFWNEYGPTLLTAAVLMVLGTAIGVAWRTWDHNRNTTETARLVAAISQPDSTAALNEVIEDSRAGPEAIAMLTAAGRLSAQGNAAEAADLYRRAAENRTLPRDMRDLARVLFVRVTNDSDAAQKLAVLKPVLDRKDSPFIWQARIEAALAEAAQGNHAQAVTLLEPFKTQAENLPYSLVERANALRNIYNQSISAE